MEHYKVIFEDNGTAIHSIKGNNPFKLLFMLWLFVKNKYGDGGSVGKR